MDRPQQSTPPVKAGEEIDVRVEAVGEKGDGIVKKNGFVIFVPGVKEGEEIRVRITKVLAKVGFAEKIGAAQGPVSNGNVKRSAPRVRPSEGELKALLKPESAEPEITEHDSDNFGSELPEEE